MNKLGYIGILVLVLLIAGVSFWIGGKYNMKDIKSMFTVTNTYYIKDSVTIVQNFHNEVQGKPLIYRDTLKERIILDSSFVAMGDTTVNHLKETDSILGYSLKEFYYFPENKFKHDLQIFYKKYYDTVKTVEKIFVPLLDKAPWWDTPVKVGAGFVGGYILTKVK